MLEKTKRDEYLPHVVEYVPHVVDQVVDHVSWLADQVTQQSNQRSISALLSWQPSLITDICTGWFFYWSALKMTTSQSLTKF